MSRYLLTWNPKNWPMAEFDQYFSQYEQGAILRWSCGNTKKIIEGDSFFLLKQGAGDKGIIGSGEIVKEPYNELHYMKERAEKGEKALYVDIKFDHLSHPNQAIPIRREELDSAELSSAIWNTQSSGRTIEPELNNHLTILWQSRVEISDFVSPDEVQEPEKIHKEGAIKKITVNAYERNPEARQKCLDRWKHQCFACGFHFELFYGPIGRKYIHVHHLKPISTIGNEYEIDPIEDLRPVCPNCHGMLHKENPPLSIEELKKRIKQYGSRNN
jgi:5-methylcytosine-specific restriction protein A